MAIRDRDSPTPSLTWPSFFHVVLKKILLCFKNVYGYLVYVYVYVPQTCLVSMEEPGTGVRATVLPNIQWNFPKSKYFTAAQILPPLRC